MIPQIFRGYPSPVDRTRLNSVCHFARKKADLNWFPATSGNFSVRSSLAETFFISESGLDKGQMDPRQFLPVGPDGALKSGFVGRPSAEKIVHLEIYRRFLDAQVVVHTHLPSLAKVLSRTDGTLVFSSQEILKALEIPADTDLCLQLAPNHQGSDLEAYLLENGSCFHLDAKMIVFAQHGVYVWGVSPEEVARRLEALDVLCSGL